LSSGDRAHPGLRLLPEGDAVGHGGKARAAGVPRN
jgi:hypothetical protein